ncbi:extracellular solute-binding protein [Microlunatus sp. GCM10028923]|uniref:extracellular solute-binding protein n=1 Tax=Microlunatus sp. GCM10028923 TaxID=3273400 RepID=UPI00360790DC
MQTSAPEQSGGVRAVELPDSKAELPTGDVTFRWLDGGGNRQLFLDPLFAAYQAKHGNITVQYDATNMDTVNETIPLGVRNGTAPDVFAIGNKIEHRTAIEDGWCQPIEDLVPDFEAWRAAFPADAFVPNVHVFDGKTYSFPLNGSGEITEMLIFSTELTERAGIDPTRDLGTWDQFRAAAKKITEAGDGAFYGLMNSRTPVKIVEGLLATAGWYGELDFKTGRYHYDAAEVNDVVDLVLAMHQDGSLWPDFAGISAADARGRMPNNVAGLQVDGPFSIAEWEQAEWSFGFTTMPTPEAGATYTNSYSYGGGGNVFVFAKAANPAVAGDLFSYLGSLAGQTEMVIQSRGALLPSLPEAQQQAEQAGSELNPHFAKVRELSADVMRVEPVPVVRNGDVAKVAPKPVTPNFADLLGGMLTGQVSDIKKELRKLNDGLNRALDDAIAEARGKGAEVSRDDYVFGNWDPAKDYGQADYDAL